MFSITDPVVTLLGFPQFLSAEADLSANTSLNSTAVLGVQGAAAMSATLTLGVSTTTVVSVALSGQLTLSATMFEPLNILNLPVVEYVYTENRLLKRYGINSGQSLTITGTNGKIVEYQTIDEIEEADYYYGGGRRHVLNDTEVAAVQNAGFSDLLTIENL